MTDKTIPSFKSLLFQLGDFAKSRGIFLIFSLSSSIELSNGCYLGGIRLTDSFLLVSIVNISQQELEPLAPLLDSISTAILVDVEKKHPFQNIDTTIDPSTSTKNFRPIYSNIFAASIELFTSSLIIPWSPSRITSESAVKYLRKFVGGNLSGNHVTIIGLGSIGFKLALSLVEEGCNVSCHSRNNEKTSRLVHSINDIKSSYTISSAVHYTNIHTAIASSSILILATNSKAFLDIKQLMFRDISTSFILDVGKESLNAHTREYISQIDGLTYQRLDIGQDIIQFINGNLSGEVLTSFPRTKQHNIHGSIRNLVSGGFSGKSGDLVVDDANSPSFILGYIDSNNKYVSTPQIISHH
ncbi:Glutamyl-tRNA reductase [Prochlorococcus marinus str. MIT 1313]|uniref:NAD(P)-binding domain-containing protein n=1 Tax=Prochlorococcus TaxID=1218 RepID=UPI0007BB9576|nr:NAD(P)-binding domain-containing protein [Prochlorococcus marinus]KZR70256.1 Glutamyl-tRNA reductase [Prochlorococcus marinus str. MIT 1313]KZR70728.1 Glutamyl-tRNA reductase [Prochlorococcus marinus str. MIT 1318]